MAPAVVTRKVTKAALRATVPGPLGVSQRYTFSAPWLVAEEGRELTLHFDPLGEWPLRAMVSDPKTGKFLDMADCANPVAMGGIEDDMSRHIRQIMRTEYHNMTSSGKAARESTLRALNGQTTITQTNTADDASGDDAADPAPTPGFKDAAVRRARSYALDPLKRAAEQDSARVQPVPPALPTRDDYAAMRRRASQSSASTTLNW